jgi:hypothetical protein
MLARISQLTHPNGSIIELPKAVPSFSSKGFPIIKNKKMKREISEVDNALKMIGPLTKSSILISAYDIYKNHLIDPLSYCNDKELVIIDSGGYELSDYFDATEPKYQPVRPDKNFTVTEYEKIIKKLNKSKSFVISNYDYSTTNKSIPNQIEEAKILFNKFPKFLHSFIIKPIKKGNFIEIDEIIRYLPEMRIFNIIGIIDNDLGDNILKQLVNIAKLRIALNDRGMEVPIHIWGGLDPFITPLYFCAGAEIFDGVSWLRYGYYDNMAIPRDTFDALSSNVTNKDKAIADRLLKNINYLEDLPFRMQRFVIKGEPDFSVWENHSNQIKKIYEKLLTKIHKMKGAK